MPDLTPRELLAAADRERATAEAADWARAKIRLRDEPIQRGGLIRFLKKRPEDRECVFNAAETHAIYQALAIVRADAIKRANDLEARVATTDEAAR